jgi:hypothetical protein
MERGQEALSLQSLERVARVLNPTTLADITEGSLTRKILRSAKALRRGPRDGSDGTRTRDLRRDRPAF